MNWDKLLSNERIRKSSIKKSDIRNEFESDFGRIIFSPALRRMHDKTQVFPLTSDDNIHSRLTHSNEVMSLGYTFGLKLCKSKLIQQKTKKSEQELYRILPIILKNICLIHDIGNAPFGHFGETIVSNYFKNLNDSKIANNFHKLSEHQKRDFLNYDGNAQGLRVLTKLQYLNDTYGLNLTYATLGAYLKYPNHDEIKDLNGKKFEGLSLEKSKHGVFFSEKEYFDLIVENCGLNINGKILRHPLCYLMEAADSIAYYIMDMEDGFNKKLLSIDDIKKYFEIDNKKYIHSKIIKICNNKKITDSNKIVNIRIELIDYLVEFCFNEFIKNLNSIEEGKYNNELLNKDPLEITLILEKITHEKIFTAREINFLESTGYFVFKGLLDYYIEFLFHNDKKYRKRALSLLSKSILQCAIDECIIDISEKKGVDQNLIEKYKEFVKKQKKQELTRNDKIQLNLTYNELIKLSKASFDDLSDYYKFRVIIDFISGMTDKFALNHFHKINGQNI